MAPQVALGSGYVLPLNFSTIEPVNRDNGCGYALHGTIFSPDNRDYMGGNGGIAVIDLKAGKYMGRVRHNE